MSRARPTSAFFFFNDTATTEIYTLSLHDALPISHLASRENLDHLRSSLVSRLHLGRRQSRSEEHTSELQSRQYLVCRLLLEKKKMAFRLSMRRVGIGTLSRGEWCRGSVG